MSLKVFIHTFLCGCLLWSAFCRLQKTDEETRPEVRWAFAWLGGASIALLISPWAWRILPWLFQRYTISWWLILMLTTFVGVQLVTAMHWRRGVPSDFINPKGSVDEL